MGSYRNGRGRYQPRQQKTTGRIGRVNGRAGDCRDCGVAIPAGAGELFREASGAWSVVHIPAQWTGSPVSGQYTYGCPDETDRMNAAGGFGRDGRPLSEHERIRLAAHGYARSHDAPAGASASAFADAEAAAMRAPVQAPPGADLREVSRLAGSRYAYTNTGARVTMAGARCIDAPCCGCCD
jgi:hypothetical protein